MKLNLLLNVFIKKALYRDVNQAWSCADPESTRFVSESWFRSFVWYVHVFIWCICVKVPMQDCCQPSASQGDEVKCLGSSLCEVFPMTFDL